MRILKSSKQRETVYSIYHAPQTGRGIDIWTDRHTDHHDHDERTLKPGSYHIPANIHERSLCRNNDLRHHKASPGLTQTEKGKQ